MTVPVVTRDGPSTPFFDAAAEGVLLIRRCRRCGRCSAPAVPTCACGHADLEWIPAAGRGHLISWAAVHGRAEDQAATVIAIVELDEGPWLRTRIVSAGPTDVTVGAPVSVTFESAEGGEAVPLFHLAS